MINQNPDFHEISNYLANVNLPENIFLKKEYRPLGR